MRELKLAGAMSIVMFLLGDLFAASTWWDETLEQRVPVTIEERAGVERHMTPVLITGATFLKQTGATNIQARSLRLIESTGRELSLQVDEQDNTGFYRNPANHTIDPDDEIVFQVDLAANEKATYGLYYSGQVTPDRDDCSDVRFEEVAISAGSIYNYNASLSNSCLLVGIRGKADGAAVKSWSKGCITRLSHGGKELVRPGAESLLWGPVQASVSWSSPKLIAQGAVRKTVLLEAEPDVDQEFKREGGTWSVTAPTKGYLKGKICRTFSLYSGLPYVECRETYRVEKASPTFVASFVFSFRTAPVSPLERGDTLYGPWEGKIFPITLGDRQFFDTEYPSEGWIAVHGGNRRNGLALFFDYEKTAHVYACVIRGYLRDTYLGKGDDTALSSDFCVSSKIEDMRAQKTACNRFGLYVLDDEDGEAIRKLYVGLWGSPLDLQWGPPEAR